MKSGANVVAVAKNTIICVIVNVEMHWKRDVKCVDHLADYANIVMIPTRMRKRRTNKNRVEMLRKIINI